MYAIQILDRKNDDRGLMPFETIIDAISGDCVAMDQVLNRYDNQMNYLSTCHIRCEEGYLIPMINMEIKDRLASRLIQGVTRFSIEKFESIQKTKFQHDRYPNELT